MFTKPENEPTHIEKVIDNALSYIEDLDPTSDEYAKVVDQLTKLHNMTPTKEPWVKPEALIAVVGNLAGIIAILGYEHTHALTSKAIGFVQKLHV